MGTMRITAQIACEAIANDPDAGWQPEAVRAVWADAVDAGVGSFYTAPLYEWLGERGEREPASWEEVTA